MPGPWMIQEPDREVLLTFEELKAKFPASDWSIMTVDDREAWVISFNAFYNVYYSLGQRLATILALNRHTFETVKIAEVVE